MWRPREGSLRVWALGLSMCVALGSVAALSTQAVELDRSHRAVAERVLQDYSAFAADRFSRLAVDRLRTLTQAVLEPVACGSSGKARLMAAVGRTDRAAAHAATSCVSSTMTIDGFFEVDRASAKVLFATGSVADSVREAALGIPLEGPFTFRLLSDSEAPRVAGYWTDNVPGGEKHVVGFVAPAAILRSVFDQIVQGEQLLPGSLTGPSQNREYLSVVVGNTQGASVYRSGDHVPTFASNRPVGPAEANMQVRVAISEAAADRLIIGGMPRSRLPLLLSLMAVSLGLLAIGTWQMHREQRLARMRVDFVRSASHELRTPLAQIRLFTDTLQLGRVRSWSEVVRSLAFVDQQTRRLTRLVDNLLAFAQGGHRRRARLEPIELGAFLDETVRAFRPITDSLGQQLRAEHTGPCVVCGDRDWLTQVVLNLLDNASKYGPAAQTITISARSAGGRARIVIEDQGPGIPPNDGQRIFAAFVRLSREHERRTGGTGIGLAVARELTAEMNGRIWADEITNGARLNVELPLVRSGEAQPARTGTATDSVGNDAHSHVA